MGKLGKPIDLLLPIKVFAPILAEILQKLKLEPAAPIGLPNLIGPARSFDPGTQVFPVIGRKRRGKWFNRSHALPLNSSSFLHLPPRLEEGLAITITRDSGWVQNRQISYPEPTITTHEPTYED